MSRHVVIVALAAQLLLPALAAAADPPINIELNAAENADGKCRVTFVIENKDQTPIDALKLDLVGFNKDNRVFQRFLADMGPVRAAKTIVKVYTVDTACNDLRSMLVNDVTACAPEKPDVCLDRLTLSSRVDGVRLFK